MAGIHIRLLGGFSLRVDGEEASAIHPPRFQALVAYLALHRDAPVPRRTLAYLFWPEGHESQARTNLRKLLFDLRHTFPEVDHFLILNKPSLSWKPGTAISVDVELFESTATQAHEVSQLEAAVDQYHGDLLPDCYDDWVLLERQRLESRYIAVLEQLVQRLEEKRDYAKAIVYARRFLQIAPLEEEHYRQLMRLYALVGDRAEVVQIYNACAAILSRELDIQPSQLTQRLYQRLIQMDGSLNQLPPIPAHLAAQREEWAQLQSAWRTALAGKPYWAILTEDGQNSNSQLLEELVQWANRLGIAHASVTCYPTDRDQPYAPLQAILRDLPLPPLDKIWLAEIVRLLPEILLDHPNIDEPEPLKEPMQINRFYEAAARVVLAQEPFLIVLNNLEWCDADTLRWLTFLQRFDQGAQLLIVATLSEEYNSDHPLLAEVLKTLEMDKRLIQIQFPSGQTRQVHNSSSSG